MQTLSSLVRDCGLSGCVAKTGSVVNVLVSISNGLLELA